MKRGEIVELDWPFSDRTGSKTRPAVVVQADFLNGLIDDTILVQITGTGHGGGTRPDRRNRFKAQQGLLRFLHECPDARSDLGPPDGGLPLRRGPATDRGVSEGRAGDSVTAG